MLKSALSCLKNIFYLIVCMIAITGCSAPEPKQIAKPYFSLHSFFKSEEQRLAASKSQLNKVTVFDSSRDCTLISNPDWSKEFALFTEADINKPAWINAYRVDSIMQDSLLLIRYTAIENRISVHKLEIYYAANRVIKIQCEKSEDNFVYSTYQELRFEKNVGFKISGKEKVLWFLEKEYNVAATFVKPPQTTRN